MCLWYKATVDLNQVELVAIMAESDDGIGKGRLGSL